MVSIRLFSFNLYRFCTLDDHLTTNYTSDVSSLYSFSQPFTSRSHIHGRPSPTRQTSPYMRFLLFRISSRLVRSWRPQRCAVAWFPHQTEMGASKHPRRRFPYLPMLCNMGKQPASGRFSTIVICLYYDRGLPWSPSSLGQLRTHRLSAGLRDDVLYKRDGVLIGGGTNMVDITSDRYFVGEKKGAI